MDRTLEEEPAGRSVHNKLVRDFLLEKVPIYRHLSDLRKEGWANPLGDAFFNKQRKRAEEADDRTRRYFFYMMQRIGDEMDKATGAMSQLDCEGENRTKILDLCMAPGGLSAAVQQRCPSAEICGISLPTSSGGHLLLDLSDPRINVEFTDITILSLEMGATSIPADHPDRENFRQSRPYLSEAFDLVICDGQVLRKHPRESYREPVEASRLTLSQLILALQRIRSGGTIILLLHKLDSWDNLELLHKFNKFSTI